MNSLSYLVNFGKWFKLFVDISFEGLGICLTVTHSISIQYVQRNRFEILMYELYLTLPKHEVSSPKPLINIKF